MVPGDKKIPNVPQLKTSVVRERERERERECVCGRVCGIVSLRVRGMASTASAALAASSGIVSSSCSNRLVTSVSNSGGGGGGDVSSSFLHPLLRTGTSFRGSVVGLTVRGGQEGNWTNRRWSGNGGGGGGGVVTTAAVSVEPPPVPKQQKKSQYEIETFTGWLLRQEQIGIIDAELTIVLSSISVACKQIASLVQRAGISNLTGLQGASNIQGEDQKKLDVISNEVLLSLSLSLL
jgi:fructose-1,6-bisphosphatase I